jgi:hypothetical protein
MASDIAKTLKEKLMMEHQLETDLKTGKYFSGAGLHIEVFIGNKKEDDPMYGDSPNYVVTNGDPEICKKIIELLIEANINSIETYKYFAEKDKKELNNALELYESWKNNNS